MKANFGILPPIENADHLGKREHAKDYADRAITDLEIFLNQHE